MGENQAVVRCSFYCFLAQFSSHCRAVCSLFHARKMAIERIHARTPPLCAASSTFTSLQWRFYFVCISMTRSEMQTKIKMLHTTVPCDSQFSQNCGIPNFARIKCRPSNCEIEAAQWPVACVCYGFGRRDWSNRKLSYMRMRWCRRKIVVSVYVTYEHSTQYAMETFQAAINKCCERTEKMLIHRTAASKAVLNGITLKWRRCDLDQFVNWTT